MDRLVTHNQGGLQVILNTLLIIKANMLFVFAKDEDGGLTYTPKSFVRNSRDFGVPQNRPRTYLIGFDTERFAVERLNALPRELPQSGDKELYHDLNELLEHNVPAKYYLASGYLDTLKRHRTRQESKAMFWISIVMNRHWKDQSQHAVGDWGFPEKNAI